MGPRKSLAVPLPRLAVALENEGLRIDSVTPHLLRCHFPPRPDAGRLSIINWMRAGDVIVERHETRLVVRVIPAFSRLCVGAGVSASVAFSLVPGSLTSRTLWALLVGAVLFAIEYGWAALVVPPSILRAFHETVANLDASASDSPAT